MLIGVNSPENVAHHPECMNVVVVGLDNGGIQIVEKLDGSTEHFWEIPENPRFKVDFFAHKVSKNDLVVLPENGLSS